MVRAFLVGLIFAFVSGSIGQAADQPAEDKGGVSQPEAVVEQLTMNDVAAIVKEIGGENVEAKVIGTIPVVLFKGGGSPFAIVLICDESNVCSKLAPIYDFAADYPLEYVNKFNKESDAVTVVRVKKGLYRVKQIIDMTGGVTRGNVAYSIVGFVNSMATTLQTLNSQLVAGLDGSDPALRAKETLWQAMVVAPSTDDIVASASRPRPAGSTGVLPRRIK
jgi:hypothetical protein